MKIIRYLISYLKRRLSLRSGYKCPICGKESSSPYDIFDDIYNHEYKQK